jgi:hypothetical protein
MEPPSISFAGQALSSGGMEKRVKNQVKVQAKIEGPSLNLNLNLNLNSCSTERRVL